VVAASVAIADSAELTRILVFVICISLEFFLKFVAKQFLFRHHALPSVITLLPNGVENRNAVSA
jgi:hypothetical protein